MRKFVVFLSACAIICVAQASWYWPFGSDSEGGSEKKPLRISELMEPASLLIDEAADLAADGKVDESVAKYREALTELDRIERENPERAAKSEFATLRNKRAYVNAAIDSMLLSQVRDNARAVAVSDTTELEKKLAAEREAKKAGKRSDLLVASPTAEQTDGKADRGSDAAEQTDGKTNRGSDQQVASRQVASKNKAITPREKAITAIAVGDYATAEEIIDELLKAKPNGAAALNLRAAMEAKRGNYKAAEAALDQAIMSNPRSHFAYYNMARLMLQNAPDEGKAAAKRYYETGRAMGGPQDTQLETLLK